MVMNGHPSPVEKFRQNLCSGISWWTYALTIFVNGLPFLASISNHILYGTCTKPVDRTTKHYRSALEEIFNKYH